MKAPGALPQEGISGGSREQGLDGVLAAVGEPWPLRSSVPGLGTGCWSLTAVGLILPMFTVVLLVTRPAHGDAAPTGAGEVIQGASGALHTWGREGHEGPALLQRPPPSAHLPTVGTWAVSLVTVVPAVVGAIAHPAGRVAEGGVLAGLEMHALHPQAEVAAAVGGAWWGAGVRGDTSSLQTPSQAAADRGVFWKVGQVSLRGVLPTPSTHCPSLNPRELGLEAGSRLGGYKPPVGQREDGGAGGARQEPGRPQEGHHSLQFISSEASSQSTNWLQRLEFPMQVPSRQRNSPAPQAVSRTGATGAIRRDPPWGARPAQAQALVTECPEPDPRGWDPKLGKVGWGRSRGPGAGGRRPGTASHSLLQGISSEPSPQSSAPLHHSMLDTHRPLLHWRKVFLQRRESAGGEQAVDQQQLQQRGCLCV